jgi:hypothetical protein
MRGIIAKIHDGTLKLEEKFKMQLLSSPSHNKKENARKIWEGERSQRKEEG